jgi:hypothetical protein
VLDDCLRRIAEGQSSPQECLAQYPKYAGQLEPLLQTADRLGRGRALVPSRAYKRNARARVIAHARAYPLPRVELRWPAWTTMAGVAALLIVLLLSTTAFSQAAQPGGALYGWKLASEHVWRALAPDRVGVDLSLADRRADELTSVAQDPDLEAQALISYHEVLARLAAEGTAVKDPTANVERIRQTLEAHQERLSAAGIHDKQLDEVLHGLLP